MTTALILKNRRKLNNYCPKTLFIKASWPILYTSINNQCLNIDVQVETCMTMSLLEESEVNDSRHYFTINLCGTGATPGSADRQVSALRYVTDCAMRPVRIYRTYTVFMSKSFQFV